MSGRPASFEATLKQYEPLMHKLVRRWPIPGSDYEDGLQIAAIALWKAWSTYDADRKTSFLTHAYNCITRRLQAELKRANTAKRVPAGELLSFDELAAGGEGSSFLDLFVSAAPSPEDDVVAMDTLRFIVRVGASSERDREILEMLATGATTGEVCKRTGLSRARIYQIQTRARSRLEVAA